MSLNRRSRQSLADCALLVVGALTFGGVTSCHEEFDFGFPPEFDPETHPEFLLVLPGEFSFPEDGTVLDTFWEFGPLGCTVEVTRPYWLQTTEVYRGQIAPLRQQLLTPSSPRVPNNGDPLVAVELMLPVDMMLFMNWRSEQEGFEPCYDIATHCDVCTVIEGTHPTMGGQEYPCCDTIPPTIPGCTGYRFPREIEYIHAAAMGGGNTTIWRDPVCPPIRPDWSPEDRFHWECSRYGYFEILDSPAILPGESATRPYQVGTVFPGNQWGFYGLVDNASEPLGDWADLVQLCAANPGSHIVDPPRNPEYEFVVYTGNSWMPILTIMNLSAYRAGDLFYMNGFRMARDASPEDVENAIRDGLAVGIDRPYW
jgi:hypothetical protein